MTQNQNQDRYKNILVIVIGFSLISIIINRRWPEYSRTAQILGQVAIGIGLLSLISSFAAKWIEWAWLKLALGLGWINSRILLSLIYFVFLLPVAWVSRLFTKDPLKLKAKSATSLYNVRDHEYKKEDLENIW
jgi:hypothetical protein